MIDQVEGCADRGELKQKLNWRQWQNVDEFIDAFVYCEFTCLKLVPETTDSVYDKVDYIPTLVQNVT